MGLEERVEKEYDEALASKQQLLDRQQEIRATTLELQREWTQNAEALKAISVRVDTLAALVPEPSS